MVRSTENMGPQSYKSGRREWYRNGKKHRDNGPADIYANGKKIWYENGVKKNSR
jgi:hypothetical protein